MGCCLLSVWNPAERIPSLVDGTIAENGYAGNTIYIMVPSQTNGNNCQTGFLTEMYKQNYIL